MGPPWRTMRGRFVRRIAVVFVMLVVPTVAAAGLAGWFAAAGRAPRPVLAAPVFVLALAVVAASRLIRRAALPVADVAEAAAALADGDHEARVEERGPPEMRRLARSVNRMAERIAGQARERRDLLADVTHELRTPLTVLQGNLEGMLDGVYPKDEVHLRLALEETRLLATLVEDLRTLSLSEAGVLPLDREALALEPLVRDAVAAFAAAADAGGVSLRADAPPGLPAVDADPVRVRQVLGILLTNAIAHTPAGGSVRVSCRGGAGTVEVSVEDTGTGITPEDLPRIFERFYKGRGSRGSGLGLAIARQLVLAHGGDIRAESVPSRGTTLRFTLPGATSGS
jgi:signal transduction histidine kinase